MKHALALIFSLLLILGPAVSPQAAAVRSADGHCDMKAAAKCVRCACCLESDDATAPSSRRDAVPVSESNPRWQAAASLLSVLPTLQLDALPASTTFRLSFPPPQAVPLYRRYCLLLI
jgi:hypothetical protein